MAESAAPIVKTASFAVPAGNLGVAQAAVRTFVDAIAASEPGTLVYTTMTEGDDPVRFLHLMVFLDAAAEEVHRSSDAVRRFTDVLYPVTLDGVRFTDYELLATTPLGRGAG